MSFDNTCRRLAELYPSDFASWILHRKVKYTELSPTELSTELIRADSLILLQNSDEVLHIEFQTVYKDSLPMRLADYRLRIHRRFPHKRIHQVVIYLRKTTSKKVYQDYFQIAGMTAHFDVIRIWEVPAETLLQYPGLTPFAVLGQTHNATQTLRTAVKNIAKLPDEDQQHEAMAASYILAGLKLKPELISQVIRRDIMQESATYQVILKEGIEQGIEQGIETGKMNRQGEIALKMLKKGFAIDDIIELTNLTLEQIKKLQAESAG
jgi:predicted transposase/invertase (TIGR01784 family)